MISTKTSRQARRYFACLYMSGSNNDLRLTLYKYLGAKDDRYADKVISSVIAFKKSVLLDPIEDILDSKGSGQ